MGYDTEAAAIRARFYAEWGNTTPIAWPNVSFTPPASPKAPWVRLTILPADARQASAAVPGQRTLRSVGQIIVQVFVPEGGGDGQAEALAEQACAIFRGVRADGIRYQGLRGEAPRARTIGNDGRGWYQVNAEIPYQRDSTF